MSVGQGGMEGRMVVENGVRWWRVWWGGFRGCSGVEDVTHVSECVST